MKDGSGGPVAVVVGHSISNNCIQKWKLAIIMKVCMSWWKQTVYACGVQDAHAVYGRPHHETQTEA